MLIIRTVELSLLPEEPRTFPQQEANKPTIPSDSRLNHKDETSLGDHAGVLVTTRRVVLF